MWEPLEDDHLKYLWAAYRRDAFVKVEFLPPGLSLADWRAALFEFLHRFMSAGGEPLAFIAPTSQGRIPVGLVLLKMLGAFAEPHVVWFPEATARNRLECALAFLVELKKQFKLMLWVRASAWKLYDHLCKYGAIRTVGKYRGFYPDGEDAFLFQGVTA